MNIINRFDAELGKYEVINFKKIDTCEYVKFTFHAYKRAYKKAQSDAEIIQIIARDCDNFDLHLSNNFVFCLTRAEAFTLVVHLLNRSLENDIYETKDYNGYEPVKFVIDDFQDDLNEVIRLLGN